MPFQGLCPFCMGLHHQLECPTEGITPGHTTSGTGAFPHGFHLNLMDLMVMEEDLLKTGPLVRAQQVTNLR